MDTGFLPSLGVGRRGSSIFLRTSRSVFIASLLAFLAGLGLFGVDTGIPVWVFAPPLMLGAVSASIALPIIHRVAGTGLEIDLSDRTVTLLQGQKERNLVFDDVIGLQQISGLNGRAGQLNLVFMNENGELERVCLYCHAIGYYVHRMTRRLGALLPWSVLAGGNQTIGEPDDAREPPS
jgi:hypothetical protein